MRILAFPGSGIAYVDGFYAAVRRLGVEVIEGQFAGRWLWTHAKAGDVAHLHWPSFGYSGTGSRTVLLRRYLRFVAILVLLRIRGVRLAWTAHNLLPHDPCRWPAIDRAARRTVIALADRIAVHGPSAAALLRAAFPFPQHKLVLIPHGHFGNLYPDQIAPAEARQRLGLDPTRKVALFLGLCKRYKNVDGLIRTVRSLADPPLLVIAGEFPDPEYERLCRDFADDSPDIKIHSGFVADGDIQVYMRAADIFVVPYHDILTSGSAVLAAGFGLPVVSIDKGFLHDFINSNVGVLYRQDSANGMTTALVSALRRQWDAVEIQTHAHGQRFEDAATCFIEALK